MMLRQDNADKLFDLVISRFRQEQPERELTKFEMDGMWYAIYGKLCRGETEQEVEKYCKTVKLSEVE